MRAQKASYDKIVLISLDTLRSDCLSANPRKLWPSKYPGLSEPDTSPLDHLTDSGAFFTNCIASAPYTSASHASFLTGLFPPRNGVHEFFNRGLVEPTIFATLRSVGYATAFTVDFPIILGRYLGFDRGVDRYMVEDEEELLSAVEDSPRIAAFAHFGGMHVPYGFHTLRIGGAAYPARVAALEAEIDPALDLPADQLIETFRPPEDLALLLRYKRVVQYHYERKAYNRLFALYLEGVTHFMRDRFSPFLERLLTILRGSRYLIVVFGDHGEEYDAESYGHHNTLNEGVVRVPLVFWGPDVPSRLVHERIRSVDLVSTLLDRMDLSTTTGALDGEPLTGAIWDDASVTPRVAFSQAYTNDTAEFVAYQKSLLETGRHTGTLRHVLYKEVAYEGPHKLLRQKHAYVGGGGIHTLVPCPERNSLFRQEGEAADFSPVDEPLIVARLAERLAGYNALIQKSKPMPHPRDMLLQLRAHGYHV
jgi:choline-sulfatase